MDSIWELEKKIENVLDKNIKDVPWEGVEVNYDHLKADILELIINTPYGLIENIKQQIKNTTLL